MTRAAVSLVACLVAAGCSLGGEEGATPAGTVALPPTLAAARLVFSRKDGTFLARADGAGERRIVDLPGVFEFQADV